MSAIIDAGENLMLDRQVSVAQIKTQGGRRIAQKRGPTLYNLEVNVPAKQLNGDGYYAIEGEVITLEYGKRTFQGTTGETNIPGKIGGNFTSVRNSWSAGAVNVAEKVLTARITGSNITTDDKVTLTVGDDSFTHTVVAPGGSQNPVAAGLRVLINASLLYNATIGTGTDANVITITGVGAGDFAAPTISFVGNDTATYSVANAVTSTLVGSNTGTSVSVDGITGTPTAFDYVQFPGSTKVYQLSATPTVTAGAATLTLNSPLASPPSNDDVLVIGDNVSFNFALIERPQTSYQPGGIVQYGTFKFEEVIEIADRRT